MNALWFCVGLKFLGRLDQSHYLYEIAMWCLKDTIDTCVKDVDFTCTGIEIGSSNEYKDTC